MKIAGIECIVSADNCKIIDSYKVTDKREMEKFVHSLLIVYPRFRYRSIKSYVREWCAHNWLYLHSIARERTKDTDLNINEYWHRRFGYYFISLLYGGH